MSTWYPGAITYREWYQVESFLSDIKMSFNKEAKQIQYSIHDQTTAVSDQTKAIVATNEQIVLALEEGFNRISEINQAGFNKVASSIEALHSDFNYNFGILIHKIEYQNLLLRSILNAIISPYETQVREFYNKACLLSQQGILNKAIDYFNESISLPTGDIFFPSYFQLGKLYLTGKVDNINIIDPQKANRYLFEANVYGTGILRTNEKFKPVLADCKFLFSQSYYYQLTGNYAEFEDELLNNAIKYCKEAVMLNPNLSQGFYHLSKYYAYKNEVDSLLSNLQKAIEIDSSYSWKFEEEEVFKRHKDQIIKLLEELKDLKFRVVEPKLQRAKKCITHIEQTNISESVFYQEFQDLQKIVKLAIKDFNTKTYLGFIDCDIKLNSLSNSLEELLAKRNNEIKSKKDSIELNKYFYKVETKDLINKTLKKLLISILIAAISFYFVVVVGDGGIFTGLIMEPILIISSLAALFYLIDFIKALSR